jgi:predicted cobalt transporter CbtA
MQATIAVPIGESGARAQARHMAGLAHSWLPRIAGIATIIAPHLVKAPEASDVTIVPAPLAQQFANASVGSSAMFGLLVGTIGGYCADLEGV